MQFLTVNLWVLKLLAFGSLLTEIQTLHISKQYAKKRELLYPQLFIICMLYCTIPLFDFVDLDFKWKMYGDMYLNEYILKTNPHGETGVLILPIA